MAMLSTKDLELIGFQSGVRVAGGGGGGGGGGGVCVKYSELENRYTRAGEPQPE
jgi:hypothetical protein